MKGTGHRDNTGDHYVRQSPEYYAGLVERMLADFWGDDSIDHENTFPVPDEAEDMGLSAYEFSVLCSYLRHRVDGDWPVTIEDLARQGRMSLSTAGRARRSLQALGWIPGGRARALPRIDPVTPALRWHIWERDNFTCQHCGSRRQLTVDHIVPRSRDGTLDDDNLQTLCKSCNSRKGAKL